MWRAEQNISQAGKGVFHKIPAFPVMSLTKKASHKLYVRKGFFDRANICVCLKALISWTRHNILCLIALIARFRATKWTTHESHRSAILQGFALLQT